VTKWLQCAALLAVTWLCCEAAFSIRYARQRSVYTFDKLNTVLRESSQTMDEVRKAATTWEKSSQAQAQETTTAMSNVSAAVKQFTISVSRTQDSISGLLSTTHSAISQQNASLLETQVALRQSLISTQKASEQAQKVLVDLDKQVSSPDIQIALDSLAATSQNAAESTKQVQLAITDVRQMADKARETYLKPVNLWWALIKEFLPLAGSAAQVVK